jgi:hypothetical protein
VCIGGTKEVLGVVIRDLAPALRLCLIGVQTGGD